MIIGFLNNICDDMNSDYNQIITKLVTDVKIGEFSSGKWNTHEKGLKSVLLAGGERESGVFESHRRYIDVHIVLSGIDNIFLTDSDYASLIKEYDVENDFTLFKGDEYGSLQLKNGMFCKIFPNELHASQLNKNSKKLVIKIPYEES